MLAAIVLIPLVLIGDAALTVVKHTGAFHARGGKILLGPDRLGPMLHAPREVHGTETGGHIAF